MNNIYMIGNTHFDPVWLWTWDESAASIHSTFRSALDRMKEDEDFKYSFCTAWVFEQIKNTDPEMFEEIKQRVKEGRWELNEGWLMQPDCFSGCGESYIRQGLYGQKYLKENFGIYSKTVFNIDSFGHSSQLPQILSKSHVDYYCFVRPEKHHVELENDFFKWKSDNGSVLAYRAEDCYSKDLKKSINDMDMDKGSYDRLVVYGVTNHGGAPTKKLIKEIHELNSEKKYSVLFSTVENYFENQNEPEASYKGEFVTGDFGVYVNNNNTKKYNRMSEYNAQNAERSAVIAKKVLEMPYPSEKIEGIWQDLLFNQFHDIIGGACIKDAYFDSRNLYGRSLQGSKEIIHTSLQAITRKINMPGENSKNAWNIVLWNLNGCDFEGYCEAEVQWAHEFDWYRQSIVLEDSFGNQIPTQIIREYSVIPGFRSRFVFKASLPAMSYASYRVMQTGNDVKISEDIDISTIETKKLKIEFSTERGFIKSVYNKTLKKEISKNTFEPCVFSDNGDTWAFNIEKYEDKKESFKVLKILVTESGELKTTVRVTSQFNLSILNTYYTFYENEDYFDVRFVINWNESNKAFSYVVKTDCKKLNVGIPYGSIERKPVKRDYPFSEYMSATDISLTAQNIFAYHNDDDSLYLTVLRSPISGDLRIEEIDITADYDHTDQGITEGKIRMFCHNDDDIAKKSVSFNNMPVIICEANHKGSFPEKNQFISLISHGAVISAIKKCEYDESYIVRIFEYKKDENITIDFFGRKFTANIKNQEIKTFKITDDEIKEEYMTEF